MMELVKCCVPVQKLDMYHLSNIKDVRVVIIGAGVAGLSTAEHLLKHGFTSVIVLEASDRIGGRVNTLNFGKDKNDTVEAGATWIHGGSELNSFFNLAEDLKLLEQYPYCPQILGNRCYRSDGRIIKKDLTSRVSRLFFAWEEEGPQPNHKEFPSLIEHLEYRLQQTISTFQEQEQEDVKCVFNSLLNLSRSINGGYIDRCPTADVDDYVELPGGDLIIPSGMSSLLNAQVKKFPHGMIMKNKEVVQIKLDDCEIKVSCKDESIYIADHVVCTQSLGCLKETAHEMFDPQLPSAKLAAIDKIPFGKVNKILFYYDEPFWSHAIQFCWTDAEAHISSSEEWYKRITSFNGVYNNPNVLAGWISGDEAMYMESLSDDVIAQICTGLFRKFLSDPNIPAPNKVYVTRWCSNKLTCGSYSYRSYEYEANHTYDYAEPVTHGQAPRILFAGEATVMKFYSTLHGARSSGLREADRLIAYYGKGN